MNLFNYLMAKKGHNTSVIDDDLFSYLLGKNSNKLPSEYTQVEYIQSNGLQYIDTNYKIDKSTDSVVADIDFIREDGSHSPFGVYVTNNQWMINYYGTGNTLLLYYGPGGGPTYTIYHSITGRHILKLSPTNLYINNNSILSYTSLEGQLDYNLYLFTSNAGTSRLFYSKMKLYKLRIYKNNKMVRNYVPCYRNSENKPGLYDLVNNVFYTNQGTGDFTYE